MNWQRSLNDLSEIGSEGINPPKKNHQLEAAAGGFFNPEAVASELAYITRQAKERR